MIAAALLILLPAQVGEEFFEKRVRPLLAAHCYECHSAKSKKLKGGLHLDSLEAMLKGGDSGPALIPGDPVKSRIIVAVRYGDPDLQMPPKTKLSDAQIGDLVSWVSKGAPAPRAASSSRKPSLEDVLARARSHWAYQPPAVGAAGDIDRFILEKLDVRGLKPAPEAPPEVLLRRLHFDLIGLPPTPEEIDAFLADKTPDAFSKVVDRLLASPRYGERWGRRWLDVARFAESVTLRGFIFTDAWRYRDWVIDAFNQDMSYDRFVIEQLAGDLLPAADLDEKRRRLVATTFLVLGNTNFEEQDKKQLEMDFVDEQLDTLGKAFLAQTIGCARCHDHKFDPIPTRDYYAMAGILRGTNALVHSNVSKWVERPLPLAADEEAIHAKHEAAVDSLKARIKAAGAHTGALAKVGEKLPVLAPEDLPGIVVDSAQAKAVGDWTHSTHVPGYIGDGYLHDDNKEKGSKTLTFHATLPAPGRYEVRLAYNTGSNRAKEVPVTILHADGETVVHVDQGQAPPIDSRFISLGHYRFEQGNQGYVLIANEGTKGSVIADAVQFLPADSPVIAAEPKAAPGDVKRMQQDLKELTQKGPKRPVSMAPKESGKYSDLPIHVRGSVHNLGEVAPRGFLQAVTHGPAPAVPGNESGRRQLAEWIASPSNPLTARVMVNRVWLGLFGEGLVRTPDNFGTTGELPSHPELLDALSLRFIEGGWSVKRIIRSIVLSRTYRLSSSAEATQVAADPDNRLLGRAARRRLDAECIRDAMLAVSGRLRLDGTGQTFKPDLSSDYGYVHKESVRSVYVPAFRNARPDLFDAFDFPDSSTVTGKRNVSTVAPQALFLLNSPFVINEALEAARRLLKESGPDDAGRIEKAYRLTIGRRPMDRERSLARGFLEAASDREAAWAAFLHTLLASPDFCSVD